MTFAAVVQHAFGASTCSISDMCKISRNCTAVSVSHCTPYSFSQMPGAVLIIVPLALFYLFMCALNLLSGLQRVARQGAIPETPTRFIAAASLGLSVVSTTSNIMRTRQDGCCI